MATLQEITTKTRSLLLDLLGTFDNGKPSFWSELTPAPKGRSGLQVVFDYQPTPVARVQELQATTRLQSVTFSLTQRDLSSAGAIQMQEAIDRLKRVFPMIEVISVPPRDGYLPRVNCSIPTWESTPIAADFVA